MRHIISVLLENEPGALSRVSGLFSARGYNIESLTVAPTNDSTLSRMTIVTIGDDRKIDQIEKQLNKLIDVVALHDITVNQHIEREIALVKVSIESDQREELDRVVDAFKAILIESAGAAADDSQFIIEMSGSGEKVDELIKALSNLEIIEIARSGATGLASGARALTTTN